MNRNYQPFFSHLIMNRIYEVSEKDQSNQKLVKTKELIGAIEFDKVYQAALFMSLIFHVSIFLWMLLLSIKPHKNAHVELDKSYSILAGVSMVCYVTGLFALHWKRSKCQGVFLFFLITIVVANIVLAAVFQREENIEYLSVAIFLIALNCILVFKAVKVYKKMKDLEQFAYSTVV